jgi:hypothetical protein
MAQEAVIVQLDPVGESGVSGTATLIAAGDGTDVVLDVEGLAPGADAQATKHAGDRRRGMLAHGRRCGRPWVVRLVCRPVLAAIGGLGGRMSGRERCILQVREGLL